MSNFWYVNHHPSHKIQVYDAGNIGYIAPGESFVTVDQGDGWGGDINTSEGQSTKIYFRNAAGTWRTGWIRTGSGMEEWDYLYSFETCYDLAHTQVVNGVVEHYLKAITSLDVYNPSGVKIDTIPAGGQCVIRDARMGDTMNYCKAVYCYRYTSSSGWVYPGVTVYVNSGIRSGAGSSLIDLKGNW